MDLVVPGRFACVATDDGLVRCRGRMVDRTRHEPEMMPGFAGIVQLAYADGQLCGRTEAGAVQCAEGKAATVMGESPVPFADAEPVAIDDAVSLVSNASTLCALRRDGTVSCWGKGFPVGASGPMEVAAPQQAAGIRGATGLEAAGYSRMCAVVEGHRNCWGATADRPPTGFGPEAAATFDGARALDGAGKTAVVSADGALWGRADDGKAIAIDVPPLQAVAVDGFHGCGLDEDGRTWCFPMPGARPGLPNKGGALGAGHTDPIDSAVEVDLPPARAIRVGWDVGCILTRDDAVMCWGANPDGAIGPVRHASAELVAVPGLPPIRSIVAQGGVTCALDDTGATWCWGGDGITDPFEHLAPTRLSTPPASALSVGEDICGIDGDEAWCAHRTGQVDTYATGALDQIVVGFRWACGRTTAGRVTCFGPQQIRNGEQWTWVDGDPVDVGVKATRLFAVGSEGVVAATKGGLKTISAAKREKGKPFEVGRSDWSAQTVLVHGSSVMRCGHDGKETRCATRKEEHTVATPALDELAVGLSHVCGRTPEGTLSCWGHSYTGEAGYVGVRWESTPVAGVTGVLAVAAGSGHTCVLASDHSVRCMGSNEHGQLGQPIVAPQILVPTRVAWEPEG